MFLDSDPFPKSTLDSQTEATVKLIYLAATLNAGIPLYALKPTCL